MEDTHTHPLSLSLPLIYLSAYTFSEISRERSTRERESLIGWLIDVKELIPDSGGLQV